MKTLTLIIAFVSLFTFAGNASSGHGVKKNASNVYWNMLEQRKFHFKVSTVLTGGPEWNIVASSEIRVNDTTFRCYLAYYTGLDFTSNSFTYNLQYKKRECILTMQNTIKNSDQFLLYITKDGYGTLKVIHPDGSGISFRGLLMND